MSTLKTLKDLGIDFDDTVGIQKDELIEESKNWILYLEEQKELLELGGAGPFDDFGSLEKYHKKCMYDSQISWIRKFFNIE
ncbi:MAG: hypothetical protein Q7R52_02660 [archaeon]|nr:hypothetical protein [archaeon]